MQNGHLVTETSSDHLRTRAEALVASLRSRGVIGSETRPSDTPRMVFDDACPGAPDIATSRPEM